jgi:hypothetical protein
VLVSLANRLWMLANLLKSQGLFTLDTTLLVLVTIPWAGLAKRVYNDLR